MTHPDETSRPYNTGELDSDMSRPGTGYSDDKGFGNSTTKAAKRKKAKIPLSIEDVFNKVSTVTASNLNPPPSKIVLTPRSAEVCLKLGVNPEILKIRDIDSFWEPDLDPSIQRMRHEAYVQRRYEIMKQCRSERKKLTNSDMNLTTRSSTGLSPEKILQQQAEQNSTLIELEKQRIEKMKARQERELEQMLQYEVNRAKLQQDMERRIQESKKKEELRKKQLEKRMKLMTEERRLREMQKLAMEEAEEQKRRELAKVMFEKEQKAIADMKRKQHEDMIRAQEAEEERKRKHEEHKMQVQRFFSEEQMKLRKRLETMEEAEKRKQAAILKAQEDKKAQMQHKRQVIEKRIERNVQMANAVEAKRKQDFLDKQAQSEQIRAAHLAALERERELHAQEVELQEQRRRMIIIQQRREEEKKKESLLHKFEEEQKHVVEVQEMTKHEHDLLKERRNLQIQLKRENVERVKRMMEYKRIGTLKKIESNDERTNTMLKSRQDLIEQRKAAAIHAKLQRDNINKLMEEVRTDASKANKIITMAMKGKVSLGSITSGGSTRASTGKAKKKKRSKGPGSASSANQFSHSSGQMEFTRDAGGNVRYAAEGDDLDEPKPYISPYDLPPAVNVGKKGGGH